MRAREFFLFSYTLNNAFKTIVFYLEFRFVLMKSFSMYLVYHPIQSGSSV